MRAGTAVLRVLGAAGAVLSAAAPVPEPEAATVVVAAPIPERRPGAPDVAIAPKVAQVARIAGGIRLDGRLDEAVWQQATVIDDLQQFQPGNGEPPTEKTEFLLAMDAENLYIGARLHDSEPAGIKRAQLVQGQAVVNDDYVEILLDTYNNRRTGYIFYLNPNGVQRDGLLFGGMSYNMDWDGIWEGRAHVGEDGWTAEIALPFKTLSFDPRNDTWSVNLVRSIRRKREEVAWSQVDRRITLDVNGELQGMAGLDQGRGLDLQPSLALMQREHFLAGESSLLSKPSLDVFYRITPSLGAALTVNTDFSATEVDDRQVNLTRFSLFFPEKRDFFLEDSEVFEFGGLAQNGRPFFSRSIGLSATGQPIDLDAGGRLTGTVGRYTVGALAVRQAETAGLAARDLFVARGYAGIGEQSTLGGIFTWGDPVSERQNYLGGLDLVVRNQTLIPNRAIEAKGWAQRSRTEGFEGRDGAWGLSLAYPNDTIDALFTYTNIGERFRPALGFVNRTGIQEFAGKGRYRYRFAGDGLLRSWQGGGEWKEIGDQGNRLESRAVTLTPLILETQPGDSLSLDLMRLTEVLRRPFALPGGLVVRPGQYEFDRLRLYGSSAGFRDFALTWDFERGDFFNGERVDTRLGVAWRPSEHLYFNAQWQANELRMPQQDFTAKIYALTANVAFNVQWAWLNVAQYDNVSGRLGLNSRLRWLPRQGQSAYLVVNYDWREDAFGNLQPFFTETTLKFNYTFRF
ncbi:MAG: carbohydrate binding family 9 domain-containing protein [Gammaproteobacteria bacterium]|nr:carbohydrate binding family 9 domain-containing protein [Gammaproteobacteria bacterium]